MVNQNTVKALNNNWNNEMSHRSLDALVKYQHRAKIIQNGKSIASKVPNATGWKTLLLLSLIHI